MIDEAEPLTEEEIAEKEKLLEEVSSIANERTVEIIIVVWGTFFKGHWNSRPH